MSAKTICMLIAATALVGVQSARAGDKERYLIGGLLGGWILNEVLDEPCVVHHSSVEVVTCPPPVYHRPVTRYEYRQVRVWVPGHYERVVNPWGRVRVRWISGCYKYRTQRVHCPPVRGHYDGRSSHRRPGGRPHYDRGSYDGNHSQGHHSGRRRSY